MSKIDYRTATPEEYTKGLIEAVESGRVGADELDVFHIRAERTEFTTKGEKISVPILQKIDRRNWGSTPSEGVEGYLRGCGYDYTVLYTPDNKPKPEPKEEKGEAKEPAPRRGRAKSE